MSSMTMKAEPRSNFGKGPNRRLRSQGKIPAVLCGGGKDSIALSLDPDEIVNVIRSQGGINTIFELSVKGIKGKNNVMIKDYQLEPIAHQLIHADLLRVAMDKPMTLAVSVELKGTPIGVKVSGGIVDFVTRTVEVSCLPKDIPETLVADVSELDIGDYFRTSSLVFPEGVTLISDSNVVVAHVVAPKEEEPDEVEEDSEAEGAEDAEGAEGAQSEKTTDSSEKE